MLCLQVPLQPVIPVSCEAGTRSRLWGQPATMPGSSSSSNSRGCLARTTRRRWLKTTLAAALLRLQTTHLPTTARRIGRRHPTSHGAAALGMVEMLAVSRRRQWCGRSRRRAVALGPARHPPTAKRRPSTAKSCSASRRRPQQRHERRQRRQRQLSHHRQRATPLSAAGRLARPRRRLQRRGEGRRL